ncbi:hypothetical protein AAG906_027912 [Vitis piasezkii]
MLYEVMLNTSESKSKTDSDNEDDINKLDSSGEISSQTSSDQEECIKELPYEPDFSEKNIPTKARLIEMNKDLKSKSPWSCSTFYVQKQVELERGTPRLVINYKPLNDALRWIRIRFLGHHIHQGTITPIQRSIEFADKFPDEIKHKKQLQRFLGSINYVQRLKKNLVPWNEDHTKIVKIVKSRVKTLPCLALANLEAFKIVETDASNIGFCGILKQKVDNQERLIHKIMAPKKEKQPLKPIKKSPDSKKFHSALFEKFMPLYYVHFEVAERCRTLERKLEIIDFLKGHPDLLKVQAPFSPLGNGESKQFTPLVNEANLSEDDHEKGSQVCFDLLIYPRKSGNVPECDRCRVEPVVSRR